MSNIEVFDPPMCCATGVCGPEIDPTLTRVSADLKWLQDRGVNVRRFNLAQEPIAFTQNPEVKRILDETDGVGLPVVIVDGRVVSQAEYPSRERLMELTGLSRMDGSESHQKIATNNRLPVLDPKVLRPEATTTGGCCSDSGGCC